MPTYTVKQGDCLSSIAQAFGLDWHTLWSDPDNAPLKNLRKDPNVLFPGDTLIIRDRQDNPLPAATAQRHTFRKKNVPAKLRLRLLDPKHHPRANTAYTLLIDGDSSSGHTDADGRINVPIPPDARRARLTLVDDHNKILDLYDITLGGLDPLSTVSGVQQRLINLGYPCRPADNILGPRTANALRAFQSAASLPVTGQIDDATRDALQQHHGS
jgi:N-acetylmuramoyl-L-alanine amidase